MPPPRRADRLRRGPQGVEGDTGPQGIQGIQGPPGSGGSVAWGGVTGTLADQVDLGAALAGKAAAVHTHAPADVTGTAVITTDARLSDARVPTAHAHPQSDVTGLAAALAAKEAANANIQAHIASAHAPSDAQKNSNITKAEIEAVLTGVISTHSHASEFIFKDALAGDVSTAANVTPVNVTGLVFNFLANSTYIVEVFGAIQAPAITTGGSLQLDVSAAVTAVWGQMLHQLANAGTVTGSSSIADDASVGLSSGVPTAATVVPIYASFMVKTGANPGTAQLRLRSEVAAVITIKAGTLMRVQKVL